MKKTYVSAMLFFTVILFAQGIPVDGENTTSVSPTPTPLLTPTPAPTPTPPSQVKEKDAPADKVIKGSSSSSRPIRPFPKEKDAPADEVIKIGIYYPMSGKDSYLLGWRGWQGLKLAHTKRSEVMGKPVQLIWIDNKSDEKETANAVSRLIEEENVVAIIGGLTRSTALVGAAIAENTNVPLLTPNVTDPLLTKDKEFIFRVCPTSNYQGFLGAQFARKHLKAQTVAVLVDITRENSINMAISFMKTFKQIQGLMITDQSLKRLEGKIPGEILERLPTIKDREIFTGEEKKEKIAEILEIPYGNEQMLRFAQLIADAAETVHGKVLIKAFYHTPGEEEFIRELSILSQLDPDLIYIPGGFDKVVNISRRARETGISVPFLTGDTAMFEEMLKEIENVPVKELYLSTHLESTEENMEFVKLFRDTYHQAPDSISALSWDAYNILLDAIERSPASKILINGKEKVGSIDSEKLKKNLASIESFWGAAGTIGYTELGEVIKPILFFKAENGKLVRVTSLELHRPEPEPGDPLLTPDDQLSDYEVYDIVY